MDVDESSGGAKKDDDDDEDYSEAINDPAFVQGVLESLPGVDPQSDDIRSAMNAITGQGAAAGSSSNDGSSEQTEEDKKKKAAEKKDKDKK